MNKKILILFGAGASYGCSNINPYNPPLGKHLYKELIEFKEGIFWKHYSQGFPEKIKKQFYEDEDFEGAYTELNQIYKDPVQRNIMQQLQEELAKYFIQFDVKLDYTENNYYKLVKTLKDNSLINMVNFASLNYDCILEKLLTKMGVEYKDYLDISDSNYQEIKLYKPHGSSNYILNPRNFNAKCTSFNHNVNLDFPITATKFWTSKEENIKNHVGGLWPVMSLYNSDKENMIAKTAIKNIQDKLSYEIHKASHIIIIGVRYMKNDTHIWGPIERSKGKILYYGINLSGMQRKNGVECRKKYFDEACTDFINFIK